MKPLEVTEHAIVRYCERVLGLDRKAIVNSIRTAIGTSQNGDYPIPGLTVKARVVNRTVVTILNPPRKRRKRVAKPVDKTLDLGEIIDANLP